MLDTINLVESVDEKSVRGEEFKGYSFQPDFEQRRKQLELERTKHDKGGKDLKITISDFMVMAEAVPLMRLASFTSGTGENTGSEAAAQPAPAAAAASAANGEQRKTQKDDSSTE